MRIALLIIIAALISPIFAADSRPIAVLNITSDVLKEAQTTTLTNALTTEIRGLIAPKRIMSWDEIRTFFRTRR